MTDTRLTDRQLDALIARHLFSLDVVGESVCVYVEGEWSPHPDSDPEGWACHAEDRPVFKERESTFEAQEYSEIHRQCEITESDLVKWNANDRAEFDADVARFGCHRSDLSVVPCYSTTGDGAFRVMQEMRAKHHMRAQVTYHSDVVQCEFYIPASMTTADVRTRLENALTLDESPARAVCLAALRALGVDTEGER